MEVEHYNNLFFEKRAEPRSAKVFVDVAAPHGEDGGRDIFFGVSIVQTGILVVRC